MNKLLRFFTLVGIISTLTIVSISGLYAADITIGNSTSEGGIINNIPLNGDKLNLNQGTYSGSNNTNFQINQNQDITIQSSSVSSKAIIDCASTTSFLTNNGNLTLINLVIRNGYKLSSNGGAITNNGNLNIINCTFENCFAGNRAGAIYNYGFNANLTVSDSVFINNYARGSGGAIYNLNGTTKITNSNFTNNRADSNGGAIDNNNGNLNIMSSNFTDNNASNSSNDGSGGAIYSNGNLSVAISQFYYNLAYLNGGAINNRGAMNVSNSIFEENYIISSSGSGGAINNRGADITIKNSNFIGNHAKEYGGAVQSYTSSTLIENTTFERNFVEVWGGGAIRVYEGNITILNSIFINNTAGSSGGAIRNYYGNLNISNSNFSENIAGTYISHDGFGGAIRSTEGNTIIKNSNFVSNKADFGGAVHNGGNMSVTRSNFKDNDAKRMGGGIFNDINSSMYVSSNIMTGNFANMRGNVIFNDGEMSILNLTYIKNMTVYPKGYTVVINATLTDDMGNPVTNQNINFTINGNVVASVVSEEGLANFTHTFNGSGVYVVSGNYEGNGKFPIDIYNGLIIYKSNVSSNLTLNKDKVYVNDSVTGKVTVVNTGNAGESDVKVVVYLPDNFVLEGIPDGAIYNKNDNTLTWTIDNLNPDDSLEFEFIGYFIKPGNYTFKSDVFNENITINNSANIEVIANNNNTNTTNNTNNTEQVATYTNMKPTGLPIIALLILLFSLVGFDIRKPKK